MVGRISSAEIYRVGITSVIDAQRLLQRTQEELASGTPILQPSDDPVASAQISGLRTDLQRLETLQINTTRAESTLAYEDQALQGAEDILRRARELTIQANNSTLTNDDRKTIGTEIDGLLQRLVTVGNAQSADGEYIFAGYNSKEVPYVLNSSGAVEVVDYNGDDGVREINIAVGITVQVNDPGSFVFNATPGNGSYVVAASGTNAGTGVVTITTADATFDSTQDYTLSFVQAAPTDPITWEVRDAAATVIASGNYGAGGSINFPGASIFVEGTPANGDSFSIVGNDSAPNGAPPPATLPRYQSAFDTLIAIRDALTTPSNETDAGRARTDTVLNQSLYNLDQNLEQISLVRTEIGVRLNRVEGQVDLNSAFNIQLERTLGELEGLDYADAISELQLQLVALEAAQQTFVKTTGLSLFNYL